MKKRRNYLQAQKKLYSNRNDRLHEYSPNFTTDFVTLPPPLLSNSIPLPSIRPPLPRLGSPPKVSLTSEMTTRRPTETERSESHPPPLPIPKCPSPRRGISQTKPISRALNREYTPFGVYSNSPSRRCSDVLVVATDLSTKSAVQPGKWSQGKEIRFAGKEPIPRFLSTMRLISKIRLNPAINLEDVPVGARVFFQLGEEGGNLCCKGVGLRRASISIPFRGNRICGCWDIDSWVLRGSGVVPSGECWRKFCWMNNWC